MPPCIFDFMQIRKVEDRERKMYVSTTPQKRNIEIRKSTPTCSGHMPNKSPDGHDRLKQKNVYDFGLPSNTIQ